MSDSIWTEQLITLLRDASLVESLDTFAVLVKNGFKGTRNDIVIKQQELRIVEHFKYSVGSAQKGITEDNLENKKAKKLNAEIMKAKAKTAEFLEKANKLKDTSSIIAKLVEEEKAIKLELDKANKELSAAKAKFNDELYNAKETIMRSSLTRVSKSKALRAVGLTHAEIAALLGVSGQRARQLVNKTVGTRKKSTGKTSVDLYTAAKKFKGWSLYKLAKELNVPNQAIYSWNNGKIMPSTEKMHEISKLLGCTVDDLLVKDA